MRGSVNKRRSGRKFESRAGKTHPVNNMTARRGGIRL